MKAAVIHGHGGLDVVKIEDVAEPQAGENDVVLQVRCAPCRTFKKQWAGWKKANSSERLF